MSRGALYIIWQGKCDPRPMLCRSLASLKKHHPELEHHVVEMPEGSELPCKSAMLDLSPFDQTLYLDADTILLDRVDLGFEKSEKHGIACCISASPYARRFGGLFDAGDMVEYDTGVLFFDRKHGDVRNVFAEWRRLSAIDSSCVFPGKGEVLNRMAVNDQASFAAAIDAREFNPFVLPVNFNLHPQWQKGFWGPLKVWHAYYDPPASIEPWNKLQLEPGSVIQHGTVEWNEQ